MGKGKVRTFLVSNNAAGALIGTDGDGSADAAERNLIGGNSFAGIRMQYGANNNVVAGNFIGVSATGTAALPNVIGVYLFSSVRNTRIGTDANNSNDAAERNVIAGNYGTGVQIEGTGTTGNTVSGNYIGVDATGLASLTNRNRDVFITNDATGNTSGVSVNGGAITGGGIANISYPGTTAILNVNNSTIAFNSGDGIYQAASGIAVTTLRSTIVARNTNNNFPSNSGTFNLNNYNLSDNWNVLTPGATDITDNPMLGALADNGGPTDTHALLINSAAIDKGKAFGLTVDGRGQSRTVDLSTTNATGGGGTDIGAYEAATYPANPAPVATADSYSVNEDNTLAVSAANGVLANDTDAEGSSLTACFVYGPLHGNLTLNSNGSFTYTPAANYNGTDSFQYTATIG